MISGRGLGHTGGTLDKLEVDPRLRRASPTMRCLRKVVREVGCAIIGQTAALAPADQRLYAIRDVTATVESIPLITASILSKKLAAGLSALVMDVKTGSRRLHADAARARANSRRASPRVATGAGLPTVALITDMNEPLASAAGNARRGAQRRRLSDRRAPRRAAARGDAGARRRAAGRARPRARSRARRALQLQARARQRRGGGAVRAHGRGARRPRGLSAPTRARCCPPRRSSSRRRAATRGFVRGDRRPRGRARGGGARRRPARGRADAIDPAVGLTELAGIGARGRRGRAAGAGPRARRGGGGGGERAAGGGLSHRRRAAGARRRRSSSGSSRLSLLVAVTELEPGALGRRGCRRCCPGGASTRRRRSATARASATR